MRRNLIVLLGLAAPALVGCDDDGTSEPSTHGPMAEGIYARQGEPLPYATPEQLETFARGRDVARRRFSRAEGLGPTFNVTFCAACHERPTIGGGAGLYRNFVLAGSTTADGVFVPATSAGPSGGVLRVYHYGDGPARPSVAEDVSVLAQRNPIPFFGIGPLAELDEAEILRREDPDDEDGDGISGRVNFDRGFVGRFGRKAQTVSIEGFIRGPLFNHLGITTDPLSADQKAALPVDSSGEARLALQVATAHFAQAAAPSEPLSDDDAAADPEMTTSDLFDLVSFSMLLAPPAPEPLTEQTTRGRDLFDEAGCEKCHTPRLDGPRGPLPVYSDLLLHDMGPDLADGIAQGVATGAEFRTQPLWGIASVGPYLHDGRAATLEDAILAHGGEAQASRDRFADFDEQERADVAAFLASLGGRDQYSPGLLPPDDEVPPPGAYGGPVATLDEAQASRFVAGRALFDRDFSFADGAGQPRLNGDSCRACHFEPVMGGAGPRGVNVMRHGLQNGDGDFVVPAAGTILHKHSALLTEAVLPQARATIFEHRQTPHLFGLGLIDAIPDEAILARADPSDLETPDGITGRPSWTDDGRLGRFGWKAQVPSVAEFVRDALTAEIGLTVEPQPGLTFGRIQDNDEVADPEVTAESAEELTAFLSLLAPPPRQAPESPEQAARGEEVFAELGCDACHVPALDGRDGPVPLYSDLLLHEILPEGSPGIEDASASVREMRTAPLWGISQTAPYLHTGAADTLEEAIEAHDGEAARARDAFRALSETDLAAVLGFLDTL